MHIYQIQYMTGDNTQWTVGILADDKTQALDFLYKNVRDFKRLQGTSKSNIEVQAITDSIISRILDAYDVERPTNEEIDRLKMYYQDKLESLENTNRELELKIKKLQQQSNDDVNDVWDIL